MQTTFEQSARQCCIDQKASPLVAEFVQIVARLVQHLPDPQRSNKLRAVIAALDDPAPSRPERVLNVLFPQGGEA